MALNRKDTPVGLDLEIDKIQVLIYNYFTTNSCVKGDYSNYESYHRAYKNEKVKDDAVTGPFADKFVTGIDYQSVFTNDNFGISSFFIANDNEEPVTKTRKKRTISIIFQVNLDKVYGQVPHRADEEFHNEISNALRGLKKPAELLDSVVRIDNVYSEFERDQLKKKLHDMQPYHVFRQDIEVQYDYDCCPTFADSGCTVRVRVETTNETSSGSSDGTAEAFATFGQGNLTYLWTTSNGNIPAGEEIKKKAEGLSAGIYSVLVTDDNVLIPACTASASGTVDAGGVIPDCNIEITGIITTPPTIFGGSDGTATATVIGNLGAVVFDWTNGETTNPAINLPSGPVALGAADSGIQGCVDSFLTTVPISPAITFVSNSSTPITPEIIYSGAETLTWTMTSVTDGTQILTGTSPTFTNMATAENHDFILEVTDPENITEISFSALSLVGNINARNCTGLVDFIINVNSDLTSVTPLNSPDLIGFFANLCDLTGTLEFLKFSNTPFRFEANFNPNLEDIIMATITGGGFDRFWARSCALGVLNYSVMPSILNRDDAYIFLRTNGMNAAEVDETFVILAALVAPEPVGGSYATRRVQLQTNAAPTDGTVTGFDGLGAVVVLESKSITITHT